MSKPSSVVGQFKEAYFAGTKRQREQMRAWMRTITECTEATPIIRGLSTNPLRLIWDGKKYVPEKPDSEPTRIQLNADGTWLTI